MKKISRITGIFLSALLLCNALWSCNDNTQSVASNHTDTVARAADSAEIQKLLSAMYKWSAHRVDATDFYVLGKDTMLTGIDTVHLMKAIAELKKTNFFTGGFINNYEQIGRSTDHKIKTAYPKYRCDEINFSFQDSDPWTGFQDDAGNYWDSLQLHSLVIKADTATLSWIIVAGGQYPTDPYYVRLKRQKEGWKVDSLEGLGLNQ